MAGQIELLRLIERIYDAAAEPWALQSLAPEIARQFKADGGLIYTLERTGAINKDLLSASGKFDDEHHASYTNYFRARDMLGASAVKKPLPLITSRQELIDDTSYLRTEIYNDHYRRYDLYHLIGGVFPIQGDLLGIVSLFRPQLASDFSAEERQALQVLVPHLQRAVQLHHRLCAGAQSHALTIELLDRLALGAIVADRDCRVRFANAIARRVLQSGCGLTVSHGCLRPENSERGLRLDKAVHDAAQTSGGRGTSAGGLVTIPRTSDTPMTLLVSPFRPSALDGTAGLQTALILFSDPESRSEVAESVLERTLGLAPAEARLLGALVAGQTLQDYADAAGVTMNTAKTQLRQIFFKTGHNRQADLIRAVLSDPLMRLANGPRSPDAATDVQLAAE